MEVHSKMAGAQHDEWRSNAPRACSLFSELLYTKHSKHMEALLVSASAAQSLSQLYPMRAYRAMSLWQLTPEIAFSINASSKTSLRQLTHIARRGQASFNFIAYSRRSLQEQLSQDRSASSRKSLRQLTWMMVSSLTFTQP